MTLIEKVRLYAHGKGCPWIALPFADGSKMLFTRKLLQEVLAGPVTAADLQDDAIVLTGTNVLMGIKAAKYTLFNRLSRSPTVSQWQVKQDICKWAEREREKLKAPQARRGVPRKYYIQLLSLQKEIARKFGYRAYSSSYRLGSEKPPSLPVNPLLEPSAETRSYRAAEFLEYRASKPLRKSLGILAGRKARREITWREFYQEFRQIAGEPRFKHTQKHAESLGDMFRVTAGMAGVRMNLWDCKRGGEWAARQRDRETEVFAAHARARARFCERKRDFLTLSELIQDKKAQISQLEALRRDQQCN